MSAVETRVIRFTPDAAGWQRLFAAIDNRNATAFVQFLTPDARFRFGNAPVVTGRAAIAGVVADFFAMIAGCDHVRLDSWNGPDTTVCEGRVTYRLNGARTVTVPFVNVFKLDGDLIADYRIYIDNSPLFAALAPPSV